MIVAHAAAATVAAAGAFAARRVSGGVFLALWVLLAGALGCIIWLTTLGAARNAHAPVFADWLDAQMGGESVDGLAQLSAAIQDERVRIEGANQIEPLQDIILAGETPMKLKALGVVALRYDPALAGALGCALRSDDAPVRVLAAGVLAREKQSHSDAVAKCLAVTQSSPQSEDAWRALADAHVAFARSGLLHEDRLIECTERARDAYTLSASLAPESESGRAALAALPALGAPGARLDSPQPRRARV